MNDANDMELTDGVEPLYSEVGPFDTPISRFIWQEKYRHADEMSPYESMSRVVAGVYKHDTDLRESLKALQLMHQGIWIPAGRIQAGAGTNNVVTLMNCYVCSTIKDSMQGIMDSLKDAALTQQQGGGIGMDFSTLRPEDALLRRTGAIASGPIPFMEMWDAMCTTIMSAGSRRGAMMGTISCMHPDLPKFIEAKHTAGRLTNFNLSVLVTDAFAEAITEDEDWHLGFHEPRADGKHIDVVETEDGPWYVYSVHKARDLWRQIIKSTYEYSEPGVIFIDRINEWNNLKYCEEISCTNPCGEQPLPPNGACNLGALNLALMVRNPFSFDATFDFGLLREATRVGVRFLDNVLDVSKYPLKAQQEEALAKRRIGIGITGLANAFNFLSIRYGSASSLRLVDTVMQTIKTEAYTTSMLLAKDRGSFPLWDPGEFGHKCPVFNSLDDLLKQQIRKNGLRNGVLLTIAPTGTTSIYAGNISSGLEPTFEYTANRKIRRPDGDFDTHEVEDFSARVWRHMYGAQSFPNHMISMTDLKVDDHLRIQAACQKHVDGSISKTINCPKDITLEEFELVYWDAYTAGCKGCTTYRPSDIRGSILSGTNQKKEEQAKLMVRPKILTGTTTKLKWPNTDASIYVTINDDENGRPYEMFVSSTSAQYSDWTTALTLMISALMRKGEDISFIPEELKKVQSATDSAFVDKKFYGSLVALIASVLEAHINKSLKQKEGVTINAAPIVESTNNPPLTQQGALCPKCNRPSVFSQEGCLTCIEPDCDFSKCG